MTTENEQPTAPALPESDLPTLPASLPEHEPLASEPAVEETSQSEAQRQAMTNPESRSFKGKRLHPFDWRRQEAADALGLKFFKLHGEVAEEFEETERYDGIAGDAMIVVWLCTLKPSEVAKAIRLPSRATEQRLGWAEKHIGGIGTNAHGEAIDLFGEILGDMMASIAEPEETPGKQEEALLSEPHPTRPTL